jgi:predicted nucleic acid-binding protein
MLLDTSGLLCLHNRAEAFHAHARALYHAARVRLTHGYVLAEFVALANARRLPRIAALSFMVDLIDNPDIETVWVDEALHRNAMALLLTRQDKTYSLCDAVSFVLMRQRHLTEALTTDRHFEQEGFRRLLRDTPSCAPWVRPREVAAIQATVESHAFDLGQPSDGYRARATAVRPGRGGIPEDVPTSV